MGALISEGQKEAVLGAISKASADGGNVLVGGGEPHLDGLEGGYYVEPTIINDVPLSSTGWTEEIFGPVLCIRRCEARRSSEAGWGATPRRGCAAASPATHVTFAVNLNPVRTPPSALTRRKRLSN